MAAVALSIVSPLYINAAGKPVVSLSVYLTDPALQGDGSGHDARLLGTNVELDPTDPFNWDITLRDAAIALCAAEPAVPAFSVSNVRCLMPAYSDALLKDLTNVQTPTTGFSINMIQNTRILLLTPAGTLASGTITLPAGSTDKVVKIASSQTITALTLNAGSGQSFASGAAITTLAANGFVEYLLKGNVWYRVG
jgi:hypothetical protein